jgi:hypothetical protein
VDLVGVTGVVVEILRNSRQLGAHLPQQFAVVEGFGVRQLFGVLADEVPELAQQSSPRGL